MNLQIKSDKCIINIENNYTLIESSSLKDTPTQKLKKIINIPNILNYISSIKSEILNLFNKYSYNKHIYVNSLEIEWPNLYNQPTILENGILKKHQLYGINWVTFMYKLNLNCILADEMGMGKTIQAISFLAILREYFYINNNHLIVVPKSCIMNWEKEIKKWLPNVKIVVLICTKEERKIKFDYIKNNGFDILITSYEGISICLNDLKKIIFETVIIDEAHKLKNNKTLLFNNLKSINKRFILLWTGTPIQNNWSELWCLLNFIMPKYFNKINIFEDVEYYCSIEENKNSKLEIINSLNEIIQPFILKRFKKDLDYKLPDKQEILVFCKLTKLQIQVYKQLLIENKMEEKVMFCKKIMVHLKKCCNHPYLFDGIENVNLPLNGDHLIYNSGKMIVLDKILKKYENKNQVLIFCSMTKLLNILEDYLIYKNYTFFRIDGSTSIENRESQITNFKKENSDIFIFLLSTRAGGLGINLFTANIVILYDSDFNPQVDLQAIDRAHRIGQTKDVKIYRLITENTIEEKIYELQITKLKWDKLFIQNKTNIKNKKQNFLNLVTFGADTILNKLSNEEDKDNWNKNLDEIILDSQNMYKDKYLNKEELLDLKKNQMDCYKFNNIDFKEINKHHIEYKNNIDFINYKLTNTNEKDTEIEKEIEKEIKKEIENEIKIEIKKEIENEIKKEIENEKIDKKENIVYKRLNEFNFYDNYNELNILINKELKKKLNDNEKIIKENLINTGFNWKKYEFNKFIKSLEIYDKFDYKSISIYLNKDIEEVKRYVKTFFKRYKEIHNWEQIMNRLKKFESQKNKLLLIQNLIYDKCKNIKSHMDIDFNNNLKFKNNMIDDNYDKFIIYKIFQYGIFEVDKIRHEILNDKTFQFSIYYKNLNNLELKSRILKLGNLLIKDIKGKKV